MSRAEDYINLIRGIDVANTAIVANNYLQDTFTLKTGQLRTGSAANGDVLVFYTANNSWSPLLITLDNLGDVDMSSPNQSDTLTYNGSKWVPQGPGPLKYLDLGSITSNLSIDMATSRFFGVEVATENDLTINFSNLNSSNRIDAYLELKNGGISTLTFQANGVSDNVRFINNPTFVSDYDISSVNFSNIISRNSNENEESGFSFKPDGTKVYYKDTNAGIVQGDLSTAWDLSTFTQVNTFDAKLDSGLGDADVYGIQVKPDGTKLYIGFVNDSGTGYVYQYSFGTAWDLSTVTQDKNENFGAKDIRDIIITPDGSKLILVSEPGLDETTLDQYTLSTSWDIATYGSNQQKSYYTFAASSLNFDNDGNKMFVTERGSTTIRQFYLGTNYDVTSDTGNDTATGLSTGGEIQFFWNGSMVMYDGDGHISQFLVENFNIIDLIQSEGKIILIKDVGRYHVDSR